MFIAIMKVTALVVVSLSFACIDGRKHDKNVDGFRQLMDDDGRPLNEWIFIDHAE